MAIPPESLTDPSNFPIFAESFELFPRAYMQVPGLDPLSGEGLLYEKVLREHGVETKLDYYPVRKSISLPDPGPVLTAGARICHTLFTTSSS